VAEKSEDQAFINAMPTRFASYRGSRRDMIFCHRYSTYSSQILWRGLLQSSKCLSGSRPVASRNGLLRFLARFVAKRRGYRRGPDQMAIGCPSLGPRSLELATANFAEFFFHALG
jgi:hypothetical protein